MLYRLLSRLEVGIRSLSFGKSNPIKLVHVHQSVSYARFEISKMRMRYARVYM